MGVMNVVVEGLLHFRFLYCFEGLEQYVHEKDIYARDAEAAKNQFAIFMTNAPKCKIIKVELLESCE